MRISYVVVAVLILTACTGAADFESAEAAEVAAVEVVLEANGLEICNTEATTVTLPGVTGADRIDVARDCAADNRDASAVVVVSTYDDAAERDGALRRLSAETVPGTRLAWAAGPTVIYVADPADDEVIDRIADAMNDIGAR